MKKLITAILVSLATMLCNSCSTRYVSPVEDVAVEKVKNKCTFPLTFKLDSVRSHHRAESFDTVQVYVYHVRSRYDSGSSWKHENVELIYRSDRYDNVHGDYFKVDSVSLYKVVRHTAAHDRIEIYGSCQNAFGVPVAVQDIYYAIYSYYDTYMLESQYSFYSSFYDLERCRTLIKTYPGSKKTYRCDYFYRTPSADSINKDLGIVTE